MATEQIAVRLAEALLDQLDDLVGMIETCVALRAAVDC